MAPCGMILYICFWKKTYWKQCRIVCEEQKLLGKIICKYKIIKTKK